MALNVTTAVIGSGCNTATASPSLAQWDNGQILQIEGADLPDTYKVEFSNGETLSAIPAIGTAAGVPIPDELLYSSSPITAYIVLTDESSRNTEYWVTIYVTPKQIPEGVQPDPEESAVIDQLIAQLNSGVERAEAAASMLENVDAVATTLQPGSPATAEYSDGVFEFGIPKGEKGDPFTYEDFTEEEKAELVQGPILDAQTDAVAAVGAARVSAVNDVNAAGTTQVGNVNAAGDSQVQAVQAKGTEVIGSIPPDYSDLSDEVSDLNNAINTEVYSIETVDLSLYTAEHVSISSAGLYTNSGYSKFIPTNGAVKMVVTSNSNLGTVVSVLTTNAYTLNNHAAFATGYTGRIGMVAGESRAFDIPVDGKYILVMVTNSASADIAPSRVESYYSKISSVVNNVNELLSNEGIIYSGEAVDGAELFTSEHVSAGDILYVNMTAESDNATYIELKDVNEQRLGLFGKTSRYNGKLNNVGVIIVPENFHHAVLHGTATIQYIKTEFPVQMITDIQNQYIGGKVDLLAGIQTQSQRAVNIEDGAIATTSSSIFCISGYLPVIPKSKIEIDYDLGSIRACNGFYDAKLQYVNGISSNAQNKEFYVPDGAYFVVFTLTTNVLNNAHAFITLPQTAQTEQKINDVNFYSRKAIHKYGTLFNGYLHVGFPRMCYFAGKTVMVYRTGYQHMPKTDNTMPAVQQMDVREADGTWKHIKAFSATDFTGVTGDARDWYIQPSRDGQYLLMVGGFSHYVNNTVYYDCFVAVLNSNLEIVDYQVFLNNNYYFFGNPLITPDGHIIFTYFKRGSLESGIYRSEEVFNGQVSTLTFTRKALDTSSDHHSECCLGYFNNSLILIQRYESNLAAKLIKTADLEGLTGWSALESLQISIQSPFLLPYYSGRYLPVVGSRNLDTSGNNRYPYLYYVDVDNISIVGAGNIDPTLIPAFNGYPTFTQLGGENYAVAYYQETPNGTTVGYPSVNTGLYYKWINAREIIPQAAYLDL